ncbi:MAG TPA: hypothetical protein PLW65_26330 [Pseudomonadota bacterium]|nr:hypothetical protein [Pseudomonadota bacterium]
MARITSPLLSLPPLSLWRHATSRCLQRVALLGALGLARAAWGQTPDPAAPVVIAPAGPGPAADVPAAPATSETPAAPPTPGPARYEPLPLPAEPISPPRGTEQSRLAVSLRPFMFFANRQLAPTSGGALIDFSYQYAKLSGLWWGIEIAPVAISSYYDGSPSFNTRAFFGYAGRSFALAGALGSGLTANSNWFQLGPVLRFGRLDRVHSLLRLMWSLLLPYPYPISVELTIEGAINRRFGLRGNFTGDSALNGFHATLGLQTYHGGDRLWQTTVVTPALGFIYMLTAGGGSGSNIHHPGIIFNLTVEPRW